VEDGLTTLHTPCETGLTRARVLKANCTYQMSHAQCEYIAGSREPDCHPPHHAKTGASCSSFQAIVRLTSD
jgi:hypothetical protein